MINKLRSDILTAIDYQEKCLNNLSVEVDNYKGKGVYDDMIIQSFFKHKGNLESFTQVILAIDRLIEQEAKNE